MIIGHATSTKASWTVVILCRLVVTSRYLLEAGLIFLMSNFTPRQPHPPPASPTIARVLPMVPEVSLFVPGHQQPPQPQPAPHFIPAHLLQPQSDISRQLLATEATIFLNGSSDVGNTKVQFSAEQNYNTFQHTTHKYSTSVAQPQPSPSYVQHPQRATREKYNELPEVQNIKLDTKKMVQYRSNRLMSQIYSSHLQRKVVRGKVSLTHHQLVV